ncbi:hypothetical protein B7P43_G16511, partial [Cryptotermes secundus]
YFSLQLDESTDISEVAQLCVFVRMVFGDFMVKEEFVKLLPLLERTRGEDIFNVFLKFVKDCNLPLSKLVAITTDGAPSITGRNNGFLALCAKEESFPSVLSYDCIIHQEALCAKVLKFDQAMNVVTRVVNYIRSSSTCHRLFRNLLNVSDTEHGDIIFHADIRWLSRGKALERFLCLLDEVRDFLKSSFKHDKCSECFSKETELKLWIAHLNRNSLSHFPHMKSVVENLNSCEYDLPSFAQHLEALVTEFGNRLSHFTSSEPGTIFISNPFATVDVSELGGEVCEIFGKYNIEELEMENLNFQKDISLKSSFATYSNFWTLMDRNKYPMIHSIALKIYFSFGSTYLCEVAFSSTSIIKNKYRSCLTDSHFDDALRAACSSCTPDFRQLAANMQCQISH